MPAFHPNIKTLMPCTIADLCMTVLNEAKSEKAS